MLSPVGLVSIIIYSRDIYGLYRDPKSLSVKFKTEFNMGYD